MALPLDRATLALPESAPKLMWEMYMGASRTMGCFAFLPMTVRRLTSSLSSRGLVASCAPRKRMSVKSGTGMRVSMGAPALLPV